MSQPSVNNLGILVDLGVKLVGFQIKDIKDDSLLYGTQKFELFTKRAAESMIATVEANFDDVDGNMYYLEPIYRHELPDNGWLLIMHGDDYDDNQYLL